MIQIQMTGIKDEKGSSIEMRKAKKLSLFTFSMNLNWIDKVVVSFSFSGSKRNERDIQWEKMISTDERKWGINQSICAVDTAASKKKLLVEFTWRFNRRIQKEFSFKDFFMLDEKNKISC